MSEKLLPCPFCGHDGPAIKLRPNNGCIVQCQNVRCGVMTLAFGRRKFAEAIRLWNTRKDAP